MSPAPVRRIASKAFDQIQPKYILGTDQWISRVAHQMLGARHNKPNQFADYFPFHELGRGEILVVPRVDRLTTAEFVGDYPSETIDATGTTLVDPPEEFRMTSIVGDLELSTFPRDVQSFSIEQHDLHDEFMKIAVGIAFWNQVFRPQTPRSFRGLPDLAVPGQTIRAGADGGPLDLDLMDALVERVAEADREMARKFVVLNARSFTQYARLVRHAGFDLTYMPWAGHWYAVHNGVKIMVCDFIPDDEVMGKGTGLTSIYCCTLGHEDKGLFGVYPPEVGDKGLVHERVQDKELQDVTIRRWKWYVTLVLGHVQGLARLAGIKNPVV